MSKPKFTQGPYTQDRFGSLNGPDGKVIQVWGLGIAHGPRTPENEANATLFKASADLYEVVRKAIQLASVANDWNLYEVEIDGEMVGTHDLRSEFEAAFKKATA